MAMHGIDWRKGVHTGIVDLPPPETPLDRAVMSGDDRGLRRAWEKTGTFGPDTGAYAAYIGIKDTVQFLYINGCKFDERACALAAGNGLLATLQYLFSQNTPCDARICALAARGGHKETLQWAVENGCPWDIRMTEELAGGGHEELLRWAWSHGCPRGAKVCAAAAKGGHLKILQWLRAIGCPWDVDTCKYALNNGHMDVYNWAKENGCPTAEILSQSLSRPQPTEEDELEQAIRASLVLVEETHVEVKDSAEVKPTTSAPEVEIELARGDITSIANLYKLGYKVLRVTTAGVVITSA